MDDTTDRLERDLAAALAPLVLEPPPATVAVVRAAVIERGHRTRPAPRPAGSPWGRRAGVVTAVVAALTLAGGAVAIAYPVLPAPLRGLARTAGLSVTPEPVSRVRAERDQLQHSLDRGDTPAVRREVQDLDHDLDRLSPADRAKVDASVEEVEDRARATNPADTEPPPSGETPPVPPVETPPVPPAETPPPSGETPPVAPAGD